MAILACAVDFSKAFNRQNHNILITTLSDMGVPGWLLYYDYNYIIMGFLKERVMVVNYKGATTEAKKLPGGGPQGTLLGLLLFLILINLCGFNQEETEIGSTITKTKLPFQQPTFHTKYVDDLLIAEALKMQETLVSNPNRVLPDTYHSRMRLKLDPEKSKVYKEIDNIQDYAIKNEMKINSSKTKFMVFNPTLSFDFVPDKKLDNKSLDTVESMKLLGLVVSNDLTWKSNTEYLTKKAYGRLWAIQRLVKNGATLEDLVDIYNKQVRSVLEFGVPVWNSSLTKEQVKDLERVQKSFHQIALGNDYLNYTDALAQTGLDTLEKRRAQLCLSFAKKSAKHPKHSHWFAQRNEQKRPNTRSVKTNYSEPICIL